MDQETFTDETEQPVVTDENSASTAAWRQELASRVQQHRARRRQPADPRAMRLDFSADTPHSFGALASDSALPPPPSRFAEIVLKPSRLQDQTKPESKIIRFPRTRAAFIPTVGEVTLDELELASPTPETPRIMEAADTEPEEEMLVEATEPEYAAPYPVGEMRAAALQGEQMNLLPSFAEIRLEAGVEVDNELEAIPKPAPLQQRFISGLVDVAIVAVATGVFIFTFAELAEEMPQSRMTWVFMWCAGGIFWAVFQYMFLMFRRATPGMNVAQLELCTFAGTATSAHARQTRALASALSGFSMGLGYAWALMDEDRMGWHDRISQTHVRAIYSSFVLPSFLKFQSTAAEPGDPYEFDDLKG